MADTGLEHFTGIFPHGGGSLPPSSFIQIPTSFTSVPPDPTLESSSVGVQSSTVTTSISTIIPVATTVAASSIIDGSPANEQVTTDPKTPLLPPSPGIKTIHVPTTAKLIPYTTSTSLFTTNSPNVISPTSSPLNGAPLPQIQTQHGLQKHSTLTKALAVPLVLLFLGLVALYAWRRQYKRRREIELERTPRAMSDTGDGRTLRCIAKRRRPLPTSPSTEHLTSVRPYDVSEKVEPHIVTRSDHERLQQQGNNSKSLDKHQRMAISRDDTTLHTSSKDLFSHAMATRTLPSIPEDVRTKSEEPPSEIRTNHPPGAVISCDGDGLGPPPMDTGHITTNNPDNRLAPERTLLPASGNEAEDAVAAAAEPQMVIMSMFEFERLRERLRAIEEDDADTGPPPDYNIAILRNDPETAWQDPGSTTKSLSGFFGF